MKYKVYEQIRNIGYDLNVTVKELDQFVDDQIAFLRHLQAEDQDLDLRDEIFDLEDIRQKALLNKYCLTVQPLK